MANFKRNKPRKQTRHPISNYGRGFNKNKDEEESRSGKGKGIAKKKPKKPYGIKVTTTYSPQIMKLFRNWTNPRITFHWYETVKGRDDALNKFRNKQGRYDRNVPEDFEPVEREV